MYSEDFRKKIVKSYNTGKYTYVEISEKFEVSIPFISKVIRLYKRTGKVIEIKKRKKSVEFKLSGKYESILLNLIKKKPSLTLVEISEYFKDNHDLSVGKSSVDRKLKSLGISVKKKGILILRKMM